MEYEYDLTLEEAKSLMAKTAELGNKYALEIVACEVALMDYAEVINYIDAWEILRGNIYDFMAWNYTWFVNALTYKTDSNALFTDEVFEGTEGIEDRINVVLSQFEDDDLMELYDEVLTYIKNNQ